MKKKKAWQLQYSYSWLWLQDPSVSQRYACESEEEVTAYTVMETCAWTGTFKQRASPSRRGSWEIDTGEVTVTGQDGRRSPNIVSSKQKNCVASFVLVGREGQGFQWYGYGRLFLQLVSA